MKKVILSLLAIFMAIALIACGNNAAQSGEKSVSSGKNNSEQAKQISSTAQAVAPGEGKSLVVYFSLPETTAPGNMTKEEENSTVVIDGKVLGNTQYAAGVIQERIGADIFRIEAENPYPLEHKALVDLAKREQNQALRPAIRGQVQNIEQYDTIFIGYPNWWGDMPMILYTFLETYDLAGKTIIPFNTHGGSGFSGTIGTIQKLQPSAIVSKNGLTIPRNAVQNAKPKILAWLNQLGYAE